METLIGFLIMALIWLWGFVKAHFVGIMAIIIFVLVQEAARSILSDFHTKLDLIIDRLEEIENKLNEE